MERQAILRTGSAGVKLTIKDIRASLSTRPESVGGWQRQHLMEGAVRGDHDIAPGLEPTGRLRDAAVLVPLVDRGGGTTVILTQRTAHLAAHAGQISFPGGGMDAADSSPEETALRETEEEIGLGRSKVELLGRLDTYITRTGYRIIPVVGLIQPPFELQPQPTEVDEIFEIPLSFILDPENPKRESRVFQGAERFFYVFPYQHRYIWGATAGMLVNFRDILTPAALHELSPLGG